jgi:hypothetical protein
MPKRLLKNSLFTLQNPPQSPFTKGDFALSPLTKGENVLAKQERRGINDSFQAGSKALVSSSRSIDHINFHSPLSKQTKTFTTFFAMSIMSLFLLLSCASQPTEVATDALQSDALMDVEVTSTFIGFRPKLTGKEIRTGYLFYPGGLVDERAYAPLCRAIAAQGFFVAIVPVPFKLAVFDPFVANPVIRENRYIRSWAIGGHSLGGAMAARFVYQDSTACKGLILYAAYPDGSNDLSKRGIPVLSISGSLDGLATPTTIENNKKYLPAPPQTRYVVLEGANHAQYGNYGKQNRDNDATMSYSEQQRRTVEETVRFLNTLK